MMVGLKLLQLHSPIGLDLGSHSIKAMQLRRLGKSWQVHAAVELPRDSLGEQSFQQLAEVLTRQGFIGRRTVIAAANDRLVIDTLELPPRESGAPIEQLALMEVARNHKLDPAAISLACWDLPVVQRATKSTAVMAVALKHEDAEALINPLEHAGLEIIAIDLATAALQRATRAATDADAIYAVLDLGATGATIALLKDGSVIYQRRVADAALATLFAQMQEQFDWTEMEFRSAMRDVGVGPALGFGPAATRARGMVMRHLENLASETEAAMSYARHRHAQASLSHLLLCGGGSSIRGLATQLSDRLNISTRVAKLSEGILVPPHFARIGESGAYAAALGLALNGVR